MADFPIFPRFAKARLEEALQDTPILLIHGPRQSGKTTLAKDVGMEKGFAYFSFDDPTTAEIARTDPAGFVADLPPRAVLDEVQRVPEIFAPLKENVDGNRKPGRIIMTGSANVLLVPGLSDSLAGRLEIMRLHPLSQCELEGAPSPFLEKSFSGSLRPRSYRRLGRELAERIVRGGFPPAISRTTARRRAEWYRNYVESLVQRDVRDVSRLHRLDAMGRLLQLAAGQTSRLLNATELSAPFQISRPTIREYVSVLERIFLLELLPPWHANRLSRLVKTPKVHMGDSGLAAALLGAGTDALAQDRSLMGQLLETFVVQEIRKLASWHEAHLGFFHFRDRDGNEVDLVLERGAHELVGIEVKASATVTPADFRGLRELREGAGKRFRSGVLLYDGERVHRLEENLYAVPIAALWEE